MDTLRRRVWLTDSRKTVGLADEQIDAKRRDAGYFCTHREIGNGATVCFVSPPTQARPPEYHGAGSGHGIPPVRTASHHTIAGLSCLGVGAQPPTPDWGAMQQEAQPYMRRVPLLTLIPGAAIFITALSVTLFGQRMMLRTQLRTRT